ncbi:MAG: lasso peptide biosynthesis B2 protein [bacterium]|nr:lasso peptide biosynthesis B2 protein [bacterium]
MHLINLLKLKIRRRALYVRTAGWIIFTRLGLSLMSFNAFRRILHWTVRVMPGAACRAKYTPAEITGAVKLLARSLPGDNACLVKGMAAKALLDRDGYTSRLCIGVARGDARLDAHAWVEIDGRTVIGGPGVRRYRRLMYLDHV